MATNRDQYSTAKAQIEAKNEEQEVDGKSSRFERRAKLYYRFPLAPRGVFYSIDAIRSN